MTLKFKRPWNSVKGNRRLRTIPASVRLQGEKDTMKITLKELTRIAKEATDEVWEDARRRGKKLPIWKNGKVVFTDGNE